MAELGDHVANEDIYKCGVLWEAGPDAKYLKKLVASKMFLLRSELGFCYFNYMSNK